MTTIQNERRGRPAKLSNLTPAEVTRRRQAGESDRDILKATGLGTTEFYERFGKRRTTPMLNPAKEVGVSPEARMRQVTSVLRKEKFSTADVSAMADLKRATAHKFIRSLAKAGLVEKLNEDGPYVFYRLTEPGRRKLASLNRSG